MFQSNGALNVRAGSSWRLPAKGSDAQYHGALN